MFSSNLDFPELWDLDPEDPDTILKAFESGLEKVGENGEFLGIPIKNTKAQISIQINC